MGILHEDQYTFLSYLAQFFLKWEMFRKKLFSQTIYRYNVQYFVFEKFSFYEVMCTEFEQLDRPQMTI